MLIRLVLAALFAAASADAARSPDPTPPITLDFVLTVKDGVPPADLTPADVVLKVGGKEKALLSLESISTPEGNRHIILLVDEATLYGLEKVAKDAVTRLLDTLLPGDQVTYVGTRRTKADFEPGREVAARKLAAMVSGPGELWSCLADMQLNIETFAKKLPRGRSSFLAVIARGNPEGASFEADGGAGCTPRRDALRRTEEIVSAAQINLHLFTVDHTNRSWGLDTVAANTGGESSLLTWSDSGGLERAVRATRRYYRATFAAEPQAPQRPQRVELKVKRPNVKVRTSSAITITPKVASPAK